MTRPIHPTFKEHSLQSIADAKGLVVICADAAGSFGPSAKRVNRLMKGALRKFADSELFEKMEEGDVQRFPSPLGLSANAVLLHFEAIMFSYLKNLTSMWNMEWVQFK